jgi:hypothetical protein
VEVPVGGYVIDLVRDGELVEVQTGGFSPLRAKLAALLPAHDVRLVHPIAVERWIVRLGPGGEVLSRRRSPKRGMALDVCAGLVSFPELLDHPRFTLEVLLAGVEEVRVFDGGRGWRRHGWVVAERSLVEVCGNVVLASSGDLADLLPHDLPSPFTTADLAAGLRRPRRLAQQVASCLRRTGALDVVGKSGNAVLYGRPLTRAGS